MLLISLRRFLEEWPSILPTMHLPIPDVFGVGVVGYGGACRLNPKGVQHNLGLDLNSSLRGSVRWPLKYYPSSILHSHEIWTNFVWKGEDEVLHNFFNLAVKFPRMKKRSVLLFKEIPPQTISDPPPYTTVCSKLGGRFHSPLSRHTLTRPSVPESKNLDSSENIIGVQYQSCQLTCSSANCKRRLQC